MVPVGTVNCFYIRKWVLSIKWYEYDQYDVAIDYHGYTILCMYVLLNICMWKISYTCTVWKLLVWKTVFDNENYPNLWYIYTSHHWMYYIKPVHIPAIQLPSYHWLLATAVLLLTTVCHNHVNSVVTMVTYSDICAVSWLCTCRATALLLWQPIFSGDIGVDQL